MECDYIICGAGITGLYAAHRLSTIKPDAKIIIINNNIPGGKISTQTIAVPRDRPEESYVFEGGATKFTRNHILLNKLIIDMELSHLIVPYQQVEAYTARSVKSRTKAYIHLSEGADKDGYFGMQPKVQIDFDINVEIRCIFRNIEQLKISIDDQLNNSLYDILKNMIYPFIYNGYKSTYDQLSKHNQELVKLRLVKLIHSHGMDADFMSLNGWIAINLLKQYYLDDSLVRNKYTQYITLNSERGGMSQLISELVRRFQNNPNITMLKLHINHIDIKEKIVKTREIQSRSFHQLREFRAAKHVIVTIPAENLREIAHRNHFYDRRGNRVSAGDNGIFRNISSHPLCVIYLKIKFEDTNMLDMLSSPNRSIISLNLTDRAPSIIVTANNPIKQLIPINYEQGIYMIYCDASCARAWGKTLNNSGEDTIVINSEHFLQELGFKCKVEWSWTKFWPHGVYYWKPKSDPLAVSEYVIKNMNIVGSSFAINQTWMEGALATVEEFIKIKNITK